jgi:hypothetical protein
MGERNPTGGVAPGLQPFERMDMEHTTDLPRLGDQPPASPWIESRAGLAFFVNALLFAPAFVVLVPLGLRTMVRLLTGVVRPTVLDTIPTIAWYVVPYTGWIAAGMAWLVVRNLRMELPTPARWTLRFFLVAHLGFALYSVWWWVAGPGF